jgi:hypothetical protein
MSLVGTLKRRFVYLVGALALAAAFAFASAPKSDASVPMIDYCTTAAIGFNYNLQEYGWDWGATRAYWDEAAVYCGWWGAG